MDNELKGEGNSLNYEYRMHDPRVGKFFAVDPLTGKYPYFSPYQFSGNRVIDMVELEGLEPAATEDKKENVPSPGFPGSDTAIEMSGVTVYAEKKVSWIAKVVRSVASGVNEVFGAMTGASSISKELNAAYNADYAPATDGKSVAITYGILAAPVAAAVAVEAGVGAGIVASYEAYCSWYSSSTIMAEMFTVNVGVKATTLGFITTSGGQYIASGFNYDKITVQKNILTAPLGGWGGLAFKSSFQPEGSGFRISTPTEFAIDFSFGKVSDQFGSKIKLLKLPQFSAGMGTYMESVLIMGSKAGVNTVKKGVKDDLGDEVKPVK